MVFAAWSGTRRSASFAARPRQKERTAEVNVRATVRTNGVALAQATRPWDMEQAAKSIACGTQVKAVSHGSVQLSVFTAVLSHRPCAVISTAHGMLALASEPPRARLSPSRSARPLLGE